MCLGFIFQHLKGSRIADSWKRQMVTGFHPLKEIPELVAAAKATGCIAGNGTSGQFISIQIGGEIYCNTTKAVVMPDLIRHPGIEIKNQNMKTLYTIMLILLLSSCSLFKKTTKTTTSASFDLSKQTEVRNLELQTAQKETQIYSFWKDSVFYQYSLIKEQVDQARAGTLKVEENQEAKKGKAVKESRPVESWIYMGGILCIVGLLLILKKLAI